MGKHFSCLVCFSLQLSVWIMVDLTRIWGNLNLSEMEDTGFVLQSDQRSREIILAAAFLSSRFLSMEVMARTFKQIRRPTNGFQIRNLGDHFVLLESQQFGQSLRAPPYCSAGKDVFFVPGFFEKHSFEPPWRDKVLAGMESNGTLSTEQQQFGPYLRVPPFKTVGKNVIYVTGSFEKASRKSQWRKQGEEDA